MSSQNIHIVNRRASYEYELSDRFNAGIQLSGTEVKSVRLGQANIGDAYCFLDSNNEMIIKNLHISEWKQGSYNNHEPKRDRKLLLNKSELKKLRTKTKEKGYTIVPLKIFISDTGYIKIEIALGRGKKSFDKRDSIKERDVQREIARFIK